MNNKKLIADPSYSLWVSASAGTGKTKILIDRVLSLLVQGIEINKILCMTFTNAAAQEMLERIYQETTNWIAHSETELFICLEKLLHRPPAPQEMRKATSLLEDITHPLNILKVKTIHSFCSDIAHKFALEMDLNPSIQILDHTELKAFIKEVKSRIFLKKEIFNTGLNIISQITEAKLEEIIEVIITSKTKLEAVFCNDIDTIENKLKYLFKCNNLSNIEELLKDFCNHTTHSKLLPLGNIIKAGGITDLDKAQRIESWLNSALEIKISKIEDYLSCFLKKDGEKLKKVFSLGVTSKLDISLLDTIQDLCYEYIENKKSLCLIENTKLFLKLSQFVLEQYQQYKKSKNSLDYNDLITKTANILRSENMSNWILYKLDHQIEHILVDEAQDTSAEQWLIIDSLSTEFFSGVSAIEVPRSIFIVGDEKQSIFSFQGANPEIFNLMQQYFKERILASTGKFAEITLDTSFRSAPIILDCVDKVFNDPILQRSVTTKPHILHTAHRSNYEGSIEVWPLVKSIKLDSYKHESWNLPVKRVEKYNASKVLAKLLALKIKEWLSKGKFLSSYDRNLLPSDIMVLVRKRSEFIDHFIDYCKKFHIPISGKDRINLKDQIVFEDLLSLAKFALLPEDDLNLACLLKSPIIGITEEELFQLCHTRHSSVWNSLIEKQTTNKRFKKITEELMLYFNMADFMSPFEFFYKVLEIYDGKKKFISRLGLQVTDILEEFLRQAEKFEKDANISLQSFVIWIERNTFDTKNQTSSLNTIQIMTVHSAKGLQAPVVILADPMDIPENNELLYWLDDIPVWPAKQSLLNQECTLLKQQYLKQQLDEYYRLLYVALTRAEDELIICGYEKLSVLSSNSWYQLLWQKLYTDSSLKMFECLGDMEIEAFTSPYYIKLGAQHMFYPLSTENTSQATLLPSFLEEPFIEAAHKYFKPTESIETSDENFFLKGQVMHRLLEFLPSIPQDYHRSLAASLLQSLSLPTLEVGLDNKALTILNDKNFDFIFYNKNSIAEVNIAGYLEILGETFFVSGKIDRLILEENEVIIIDYKTNKILPKTEADIKLSYLKQILTYRQLIKKIFPQKNIRIMLLWTEEKNLMEISPKFIDNLEKEIY
jgi:ATP-dependent helicase/nuclease subunit A